MQDVIRKKELWQEWMAKNNSSSKVIRFSTNQGVFYRIEGSIAYRGYTAKYIESDTRHFMAECVLNQRTPFSLIIWREDYFDKIMKVFGQQDIVIGDDRFDEHYNIQSNSRSMACDFFLSQQIKDLILNLDLAGMWIMDEDDGFSISYRVGSDMVDMDSYDKAHDLFCAIIDRLIEISAIENLE